MPIDVAAILGVIQGVTEFIPVSSSGHLILGREIIGVSSANALAFDAVLQMATAFAILAYFWSDIIAFFQGTGEKIAHTNISLTTKTIGVIAVAIIPAVVAGLFLEPVMETVFRNTDIVAGGLIVGSLLILAAEHIPRKDNQELTMGRGVVVGLFQCLALIPGMSRSGSTISGGLFAGFSRQTATSFSFLLGLPIFLGAGAKELLELGLGGNLETLGWPLLVGSIAAFVSGLAAMHALMYFVRNHRLDWFAGYRIIIAVLVLVLI